MGEREGGGGGKESGVTVQTQLKSTSHLKAFSKMISETNVNFQTAQQAIVTHSLHCQLWVCVGYTSLLHLNLAILYTEIQ